MPSSPAKSPSTGVESEPGSIAERAESVDWTAVALAIALAPAPALGVAFIVDVLLEQWAVLVFGLSWIAFGYQVYLHPGVKPKIGATAFYLALEAFVFPVSLLLYPIVLVAIGSGGAVEGPLGGGTTTIVATFLGWSAGIVLFLLSSRLESAD